MNHAITKFPATSKVSTVICVSMTPSPHEVLVLMMWWVGAWAQYWRGELLRKWMNWIDDWDVCLGLQRFS